ncbi:MAG TPA: MBL fold metallo-hydrolase, partial [Candidatus Obscuribacterales bacterium]
DRDHRPLAHTVAEFETLIATAAGKRGKILVPTFAVGRAQQILYHLAEMFREGRVKPFPVYLDSPMAIAATRLYEKHHELMDEEAMALHSSGQLRRDLATVKTCETADESRALNTIEGPCLILAGAGMCNAGRILHHLKHNLWMPSTAVIIVGYQARGSLGRLLLEGAPKVKIFGETVVVRATVRGLGGFSAHAGQSDLLRWLEPMTRRRPRVIITHGEDHPRAELSYKIKQRYGIAAEIPKMGEVIGI